MAIATHKINFWKSLLTLYLIGFIGILSLLLILIPQIEQLITENPQLLETPVFILALLSLITPSILLAISVVIGLLLAPKLSFRSYIVEFCTNQSLKFRLWDELRLGFLAGILVALLIVGLEIIFRLYIIELNQLETLTIFGLNKILVGVLYGGLTEELLLRWGFMTLVAWGFWRIFQKGQNQPKTGLIILAIVISSLVFGLGHLPILSTQISLTLPIIIRTIVLNTVGGLVFGWLYWRRSLETAMIAHASTHIGFAILTPLLSLL
ncbi:Abortive infection protein [Gloeothece citriformis PCC 7424]|uniref:Abortive infection protein n=1 Tax=Gloeothece citriformis (strain PCC 7424) TaxID=65393 RepID=B7K8A9_GLOC7|nr:CPBP family intramembrane glutamic endopeptidase [Gloeothece citriformis]ACK69869.1 Abortive infection protein [Gloeothece citriformis PCC 7424]